jgi:zinc/manganese transport system permease protein
MLRLVSSDIFRNAVAAGTIAAIAAALVGYFLVLRAQAFAGEALTDICFAGSTGAALAGISPLLGMLIFAFAAAFGIGALGNRTRGRDVEIGMALSMATGLGVLFIGLYAHHSASHATAGINLLFGSILSIRPSDIRLMLLCGALVVAALAAVSRPLLFSTVDPVAARAQGLPVLFLSVAFMIILAVATAMCVLTIGALLAVSLLVAPAAAALRIARRPAHAIVLAAILGLFVVWGGLLASFVGPWRHPPIGFSISSLGAIVYLAACAFGKKRRDRAPRGMEHPSREVAGEGGHSHG